MSSVKAAFNNKKAFIGYIMGGDPGIESTRDFILEMERAGADLVEIGIPFSDPVAEGEVIQKANIRALKSKTTIDALFAMVKSLQNSITIPLVFMTYLNPVFRYGYDKFMEKCADSGISGVIIPDMPYEEQGEILPYAKKHGVDIISLVAPTSDSRIGQIALSAEGFIYLVSSMGVTGVRGEIKTDVKDLVNKIKIYTNIPVAVGFGIHSPEQAGGISQYADGVIIGSALVRIIEEFGIDAAGPLRDYIKAIKNSMAI